jgi:hypothetical protein
MDEKIRKLGPNPIKRVQNTAAWNVLIFSKSSYISGGYF